MTEATRQALRRHPPGADLVRVLAIGMVGAFHIWQQSWVSPGRVTEPLVRTGYLWVDCMILLSAFCLYLPFALDKTEKRPWRGTKGFYTRRAIRLLPLYYFSVLLEFFGYVLPHFGWNREVAADLLQRLTLTFIWCKQGWYTTRLHGVLWTMGVLLWLYLLFPLLAKGMYFRPVLTVTGMVAVSLAYTAAVLPLAEADAGLYGMLFENLPAFLGTWAVGFCAAQLYAAFAGRFGRWAVCWLGGGLALFCGLYRLIYFCWTKPGNCQIWQLQYRLPYALGFAALLLCLCWGLQTPLLGKVLRWLAGLSYAFYIWHQTLAVHLKYDWRLPPWTGETPPNQLGDATWMRQYNLLAWAAALAMALACHELVEKPATALLKRLQNRQKTPAD